MLLEKRETIDTGSITENIGIYTNTDKPIKYIITKWIIVMCIYLYRWVFFVLAMKRVGLTKICTQRLVWIAYNEGDSMHI